MRGSALVAGALRACAELVPEIAVLGVSLEPAIAQRCSCSYALAEMRLTLLLLLIISATRGLLLAPRVAPHVRAAAAAAPARAAAPLRAPPCVALGGLLDGGPTVLVAEEIFGQVFLAGMSIALAGFGSTVLVGMLANANFDNVEKSFFEAQDEQLRKDAAASAPTERDAAVVDFFSGASDASPPPPPAPPPPAPPPPAAEGSSGVAEPVE